MIYVLFIHLILLVVGVRHARTFEVSSLSLSVPASLSSSSSLFRSAHRQNNNHPFEQQQAKHKQRRHVTAAHTQKWQWQLLFQIPGREEDIVDFVVTKEQNASTAKSFGSLIMQQMQNQTTDDTNHWFSPDQAIPLDAIAGKKKSVLDVGTTPTVETTSTTSQPLAVTDETTNASSSTTTTKNETLPTPTTTGAKTKEEKEEDDDDDEEEEEEEGDLPQKETDLSSIMDPEIDKELDESITYLNDTPESLTNSIPKILDLPEQYDDFGIIPTTATSTLGLEEQKPEQEEVDEEANIFGSTTTHPQPLSMPEHYRDRIGRDMRHLAVSIVSSIEDISQWRTFCQENGGLMPLLLCVREGSRSISVHKSKQETVAQEEYSFLEEQQQEESFMAALSACRALRDLCAMSPDVAAVITDGILRANAAWSTISPSKEEGGDETDSSSGQGNLMSDFMTMLRHANEYSEPKPRQKKKGVKKSIFKRARSRRDARLRCKLYVTQLLLAMTVASDDAVQAIRETEGLSDTILECSSYTRGERTRRWLRYPGLLAEWMWRTKIRRRGGVTNRKTKDVPNNNEKDDAATTNNNSEDHNVNGSSNKKRRRPFLQAAAVGNDLDGHVRRTANQILAAVGYNRWVPKFPGQKGLRILCLDGGGARGMAAVSMVRGMVEAMGEVEVSDSFDIIAGTSTGAIIAFLIGLKRETSAEAVERYNQLIKQIFVKSPLSATRMLFTTATYDESHFMSILSNILQDYIMLDSRADPAVPLVCGVASKMSSQPTHVALFRNYNYAGGELRDPFTINADKARIDLQLPLELEDELIRSHSYHRNSTDEKQISSSSSTATSGDASRHPGSFRVLQRHALRASTAAPTFFKPVMMGGEMYCDGGIVASNPTAVALHEARSVFPNVPIELVVSIGTGGFHEQKNSPKIGWDGIIGQIVDSATDGEQIHHLLEDILGEGGTTRVQSHVSQTRYFRFNPILGMPDEYPIDVTEPKKLAELRKISKDYLDEPEQKRKLAEIHDILHGRQGWRKLKNSLPFK